MHSQSDKCTQLQTGPVAVPAHPRILFYFYYFPVIFFVHTTNEFNLFVQLFLRPKIYEPSPENGSCCCCCCCWGPIWALLVAKHSAGKAGSCDDCVLAGCNVVSLFCCVLPVPCKRHSHTNLFIPGFQFLVCRTFFQHFPRGKTNANRISVANISEWQTIEYAVNIHIYF